MNFFEVAVQEEGGGEEQKLDLLQFDILKFESEKKVWTF